MILQLFYWQLTVLALSSAIAETTAPKSSSREPFLWGVATAAYQTEGAVAEDGRGPSIWDTFSAIPGKVNGNDTATIADDSYHKVAEDVALIQRMGLNAYRFSISWSRILPLGYGAVNQAGLDHYGEVVDALLAAGIEPLVTLYHWDLPQGLQDRYGGWLSENIEADFANYAGICFQALGDRVKKWTTLNEPWTAALQGYVTGSFAPGRCSNRAKCTEGNSSTEGYITAHNMLNAHAAVVQLYRSKYQSTQGGIIGITLNHDWGAPLRPDNLRDIQAAQRRNEFAMGWFADPINFGRYPQSMVDLVGSRLPQFSEEQQQRLVRSYDFIGLNHYSSKYYFDAADSDPFVEMNCSAEKSPSPGAARWGGWSDDQHTVEAKVDLNCTLIGPQADSPWLNVVPWGFRRVIMWLHHRYSIDLPVVVIPPVGATDGEEEEEMPPLTVISSPVIYITENGCDVPNEGLLPMEEVLNDTFRIQYYSEYLQQMDLAIAEGANVVGYFAWSLLDNFEWADGFSKRFGLHYVDYSSEARPRYPKASSEWFAQYAASHSNCYAGRVVGDTTTDDSQPTAAVQKACQNWFSCLMDAIAFAVRNKMPLVDL